MKIPAAVFVCLTCRRWVVLSCVCCVCWVVCFLCGSWSCFLVFGLNLLMWNQKLQNMNNGSGLLLLLRLFLFLLLLQLHPPPLPLCVSRLQLFLYLKFEFPPEWPSLPVFFGGFSVGLSSSADSLFSKLHLMWGGSETAAALDADKLFRGRLRGVFFLGTRTDGLHLRKNSFAFPAAASSGSRSESCQICYLNLPE